MTIYEKIKKVKETKTRQIKKKRVQCMEYFEFKQKLILQMKKFAELDLEESQCKQFFDYMTLLLSKNEVMNLTTITDPDEVIIKHFVDSCMVYKFYNFEGKKVLDMGTGAGFPGIPIAIIDKSSHFTLTDTLGKRINFLLDVIESIKLENIELVKARAEDFAVDKKNRESFDFVVARAVANLSTLSEYCLPCVKIGGKFLSYKLDDCDIELNKAEKAIRTLGGLFHVKHSYELIPSEPKRSILEFTKEKNTPKQYPRKAGTPSKNPL